MVAGLLSRKADAFAALLDGTDPAAASAAAAKDPALAHLAGLTQRLGAMPQPTPAFKSALRDQLMSAASHSAATSAAPSATPPSSHSASPGAGHGGTGAPHVIPSQVAPAPAVGGGAAGTSAGAGGLTSTFATLGKSAPLWIKLFTGGVVVAVGATGVGVSAHRALPGDFFYGVKRQVEAVQLDLASGTRDKATTQLGFAHARLNEIKELIARDHVAAGKPISSDTAANIRSALQNWAEDAGVATTSLLQQITALGSSTVNAATSLDLRKIIATFTNEQFVQLGSLLPTLPAGPLQSLTVSALGYLQRVDQVLGGNPVDLLNKLPIPVTKIPGLQDVLPQLNLPHSGNGTTGSSGSSGSKLPLPLPTGSHASTSAAGGSKGPNPLASVVPSVQVPLPSVGPSGLTLPSAGLGGVLPSINVGGSTGQGSGSTGGSGSSPLKSTLNDVSKGVDQAVQSAGGVVKSAGGAVDNTVKGAGDTVKGAVGTVTGGLTSSSGPSLSLPTAIPTLPPLPKLPGLGG